MITNVYVDHKGLNFVHDHGTSWFDQCRVDDIKLFISNYMNDVPEEHGDLEQWVSKVIGMKFSLITINSVTTESCFVVVIYTENGKQKSIKTTDPVKEFGVIYIDFAEKKLDNEISKLKLKSTFSLTRL